MADSAPVDKALLAEARATLSDITHVTPLLHAPALDRALGARVLVKAECLQLTGSFKLRGAYFRLTRLTATERRSGAVAFSSGNFAQGLAAAGHLLGVPITIVMPEDAPPAKIEATRGWGATVVSTSHGAENREFVAARRAEAIAAETGAALLHPFDDPLIVAGQATATAEMIEQAVAQGHGLDAVIVPVGGGGLIAGAVLACEGLPAAPMIVAAEPVGYDDFGRSLASGTRLRNEQPARTLCDALQAGMPGAVPFGIARGQVARAVAVDDDAVRRAMALAFRLLKIVLEPSGAVGLAAISHATLADFQGRTVAVIASGGNIALEDFARITGGQAGS